MRKILTFPLSLLDPDRQVFAFDKLQHFLSGIALCWIATVWLRFGIWGALLFVLYSAVLYEIAQTDVAYSIKDGSGARYVGRPGFGFGILDISAGMVGALLYVGLRWLL